MTTNEQIFRAMFPKLTNQPSDVKARTQAVRALSAMNQDDLLAYNDYVSVRMEEIRRLTAARKHLQAVKANAFDALVDRFTAVPNSKLVRLAHKALWFGLYQCYDAIVAEMQVRSSI